MRPRIKRQYYQDGFHDAGRNTFGNIIVSFQGVYIYTMYVFLDFIVKFYEICC